MLRSLQSSVGSYQEFKGATLALFGGVYVVLPIGTSGLHLALIMDRLEC